MEAQPYHPDINYDGVIDAEELSSLLTRAEQAIQYLKTLPYKNILVVSHGSTGRALRHHLDAKKPFDYPKRFANAELVKWVIR